ncbi:hypothetical protein B0H14DRAFT_3534574 [Mycena olivaceomarginata]|nr:hypothetical protein B0H14DRAFT_3534574 [Mycena olivaceomarginata]
MDSDLRFAYTDGLFNFTYGPDVVVECNPYCSCPTTCGNRVVQRPRRIPIEVFKTERRGWAVHATEDVVRGPVVGVYTGKLIPRAEAEKLQGDRKQYCFDLDYNEEDVPSEKTYSVDAFECGNWTRFINHSCSPNLRVQPVVYDTLPYIAWSPSELSLGASPPSRKRTESAALKTDDNPFGGSISSNCEATRPRETGLSLAVIRGFMRPGTSSSR